jgi:flagellar motor switch protein FliM
MARRAMQDSAEDEPGGTAGGVGVALRRKLRAPSVGGDAGAGRAWRTALQRAAESIARTDLAVLSMADRAVTVAELMDMPGPHSLILLLDGPCGHTGLCILSAPLLAALVETMTLGQVLRAPPVPRAPSRTDSMMAQTFIDTALRQAEGLLMTDPDLAWISDFQQAGHLTDPRPLGFMLDDVPFRLITAQVALGGGVRTGDLMLILPADGRGRAPRPAQAAPTRPGLPFRQALAEQVAGAEVRLDGVIARLSEPLSRLMALVPGDVLALPDARLDLVAVVAIDGTTVARGRLGQAGGQRAIRLTQIDGAETAPRIAAA